MTPGPAVLEILASEPHPLSATFTTTRATCRLADGRVVAAVLKTGGAHPASPDGIWGGVPYEALVYRAVLNDVPGVPQLYDVVERDGVTVLVLEEIVDATPGHRAGDAALVAAADWIGRFHRAHPAVGRQLVDLDGAWYVGVGHRARAAVAGTARAAVVDIAARELEAAAELFHQAGVIVHGDLYADNVLFDGERATVLDWGWAATGVGAVDLATLIERWPEPVRTACIDAYVDARWDGAPPAHFDELLRAANLHLLLRWIGHSAEWAADPRRAWRYDELDRLLGRPQA